MAQRLFTPPLDTPRVQGWTPHHDRCGAHPMAHRQALSPGALLQMRLSNLPCLTWGQGAKLPTESQASETSSRTSTA